MKSGALIEELRSVQVQVAERRQDETAFGDLFDVGEVLSVVRCEADDKSVAVDFWEQRVVSQCSVSGR